MTGPAAVCDDVLGRDADIGALLDDARERVLGVPANTDLLRPDPDGHRPARLGRGCADDGAVVEPHDSLAVGLASQQVRNAEKPCDERCFRVLVELGRSPELLDPARVHDRDRVGHRHRLFLVMGDVDEGDPEVALQPLDEELHLLSELQVEGAERLVEQEHARAVDERASQGDTLCLAAGELAAACASRSLRAARARGSFRPGLEVPALDAAAAEAEGDVLEDREVREERVALEDGVDVPLVGRAAGDIGVAEVDRACGRLLEAADHPERRRLAAARGAEQGEEPAVVDREGEIVDRDDVVETLGDVLQPDVGGASP